MGRLNGLTKAAHKSAGNSMMCDSCVIHKNKMCSPDINRACYDSHVEGFKKGAHFTEKLKKELIRIFDKEFGKDINQRLDKLKEETMELTLAIMQYKSGLDGMEAIKDEMSDVLAVLMHVSSIIGMDTRKMIENALDKVIGRKENPDYKRMHPHIENK